MKKKEKYFHGLPKSHAPAVGGIIAGAIVLVALVIVSGPLFPGGSPEAQFTAAVREGLDEGLRYDIRVADVNGVTTYANLELDAVRANLAALSDGAIGTQETLALLAGSDVKALDYTCSMEKKAATGTNGIVACKG